MRTVPALLILSLVASLTTEPAVAAGPPAVKPFSAEYVYTVDGGPMPGSQPIRVAVGSNGMRVDYPLHIAVVHFRPGNARILMLDPTAKTYTAQIAFYDSEEYQTQAWMFQNPEELSAACAEEGGECSKLGSATFAGRAVERWRVGDEEGEGEALLDPALGIVLRSVSGDGSGLEIRNLSVGMPPRAALEVPDGYQEVPSGH